MNRVIRFISSLSFAKRAMVLGNDLFPLTRRSYRATTRFCNVSSVSTELLELNSENPTLHVVFIPGNPGIVSYYKDFVEELFQRLEEKASVTAIGHISHTGKDWENGKMFSLQDQINHKVDFFKQEFQKKEIPIIMVGHSIGSYICLEILRQVKRQIKLTVGLYPFITLNRDSLKQRMIGVTTMSPFLCIAISLLASFIGSAPNWIKCNLVRICVGRSWSSAAVDATCSELLKYHTIRNVLYMAKTEFKKLSDDLDWAFMRRKKHKISFLFGIDDHWGPSSVFEEQQAKHNAWYVSNLCFGVSWGISILNVSKQVPDISLSIERDGHSHSFCCSECGSLWVAQHVANLIKNHHEM